MSRRRKIMLNNIPFGWRVKADGGTTEALSCIGKLDADFVMHPSGYANSKLYSQRPVNGDGDFTFNRDSRATRVGSNGLIQTSSYYSSELVTNGDFASNITGWSAKDCTIVSDSGKLKVDNSSGNDSGGAYQDIGLVTGKQYKMTATMQLLTGASNGRFKLLTSQSSGTGQSIVYTGSTLVVAGAAVTETFYFTPGSTDVSIQLSCDEVSATYTIDNISVKEVLGDQPRLDYTNGSCPSLLLEPASTNLVTYSEDFSQSFWTKTGVSIVSNNAVSPYGTLNADKLVEGSLTGITELKHSSQPVAVGVDYPLSIYAKSGDRNLIQLTLGGNSGHGYVNFNLDNGTITKTGGSIVSSSITQMVDGWYLCTAVVESLVTSSGRGINCVILISETSTRRPTRTGDGVSVLYIFGAQMEEGSSYPTSYIPTNGSTVTRTVETCTGAGDASTFNSEEGVLYVEIAAANNLESRRIAVSDGTNNNRVHFGYGTVSNQVYVTFKSGGVTSASLVYILSDITQFHKFAIKWKVNDFSLWVDGVEQATDVSGAPPVGLSTFAFNNGSGADDFYGNCKDIRVYKTALTDAELTTLTTL